MESINYQNIEAYIKDFKTKEIRIGEWLVYKNGGMIAAGTKESMESANRNIEDSQIIQAYDPNQ
jgi:hypothetical protein